MLELARGLSAQTLTQIAQLENDSMLADGGRLKLEWSTLTSRSGNGVDDVLWWEDGRLIGFVGLYAFGGPVVELAGMVHPNSRRRGVGTRLLDEATKLCREQGRDRILLVVPRTSPGGRALAESRRGILDHSEYALDAAGVVATNPPDPSLTLRPVSSADLADEARILAEAFGRSEGSVALDAPDESRLVGERDGRVIATIRVHRTPEQWDIYGFAVESSFQGLGIGRDILRRVCDRAHEAGVTRLHLEVEVNNDRALGLYTSVGFTPTSTDDYYDIPL